MTKLFNYFKNGNVNAIWTFYKKSKKHGLYEEFYPTGQKSIECRYKNGKLTGEYIEFYPNGQIMAVYNFVAGRLEGIYKKWSNNGILQTIGLYIKNFEYENPIFVVGNTIFTADEYKQAYNTGNEEFKKLEVKGFRNKIEANKYLDSLKNKKKKDKQSLNILSLLFQGVKV